MNIREGGAISNLKDKGFPVGKIETLRFVALDNYKFEMWINEDCLSYLSINELLSLKDEIQSELKKAIK